MVHVDAGWSSRNPPAWRWRATPTRIVAAVTSCYLPVIVDISLGYLRSCGVEARFLSPSRRVFVAGDVKAGRSTKATG